MRRVFRVAAVMAVAVAEIPVTKKKKVSENVVLVM
jgi:hypothetical protein